MKAKRMSISKEGVDRLEYAVNYLLHNAICLNDLMGDLCTHLCNLDGTETEKLNAREFVRNSPHIRALVYSTGDMLEDLTVLLDAVVGEMYDNSKESENEDA